MTLAMKPLRLVAAVTAASYTAVRYFPTADEAFALAARAAIARRFEMS